MAEGYLHHHGKDDTVHNVKYNEGGAGDEPKQSFRGETREVQEQRHHTDKTLLNGVGSYGCHVDGGLLEGQKVPLVPAKAGVFGPGTDTTEVLSHPPGLVEHEASKIEGKG